MSTTNENTPAAGQGNEGEEQLGERSMNTPYPVEIIRDAETLLEQLDTDHARDFRA